MLVDDDPTSLAIGRAILESEYRLTLARSPLQAFGFIQNEGKPDLILLDIIMSGQGGMEFLEKLKATEDLKDIPVIIMTSERQIKEEINSYLKGAVDYLQKPVNSELLRLKIKQHLYFQDLIQENAALRQVIGQIKKQLYRLPLPTQRPY